MRPAPLLAALALVATLATALSAGALPRRYALKPDTSSVGFVADFGSDRITGRMPVTRAELTLDFASLANCRVSVTLDAAGATASLPFAAQAMKGPLVLDTGAHPEITFVSTAVHDSSDGAVIEGLLTIRGVTRPITLDASLYRRNGTKPGDLDHLVIRLTGTVHRSDYGAGGWADMVGDAIQLDILASIDRTG